MLRFAMGMVLIASGPALAQSVCDPALDTAGYRCVAIDDTAQCVAVQRIADGSVIPLTDPGNRDAACFLASGRETAPFSAAAGLAGATKLAAAATIGDANAGHRR